VWSYPSRLKKKKRGQERRCQSLNLELKKDCREMERDQREGEMCVRKVKKTAHRWREGEGGGAKKRKRKARVECKFLTRVRNKNPRESDSRESAKSSETEDGGILIAAGRWGPSLFHDKKQRNPEAQSSTGKKSYPDHLDGRLRRS